MYPTAFNPATLEDPTAQLREIVEESTDISYELHVYVDGELVVYKKTRNPGLLIGFTRIAQRAVDKKIDELTELRAEADDAN